MELLDPYLSPIGGDDDDDEFEIDADLFASFPNALLSQDRLEGGGLLGPPAKITIARRMMAEMREKLDTLEKILTQGNELGAQDVERLMLSNAKQEGASFVIEGVFDGEHMMGADGKQYLVPPNYASKSKLVEGDILKLTVNPAGTFMYKQIGPIERQRIVGVLTKDEVTGDYVVIGDAKKWNVLRASVTFFHAEPGNQLVILVPKNAPSRWAAVENVIRTTEAPVATMSSGKKKRN